MAHALQALALVAKRGTHERAWAHPERQRLREARCCHGHVAGRLGVALWEQQQRKDGLRETADGGVELTDAGREWLATLGVVALTPSAGQRLAGSLARQSFEHFVAEGWLRQRTNTRTNNRASGGYRVLGITPSGRRLLLPLLGLS